MLNSELNVLWIKLKVQTLTHCMAEGLFCSNEMCHYFVDIFFLIHNENNMIHSFNHHFSNKFSEVTPINKKLLT